MLGLEPNELALVVFLAVLITAMGWLSRLGEWLGEVAGRRAKGGQRSPSDPPRRASKPPPSPPSRDQRPSGGPPASS